MPENSRSAANSKYSGFLITRELTPDADQCISDIWQLNYHLNASFCSFVSSLTFVLSQFRIVINQEIDYAERTDEASNLDCAFNKFHIMKSGMSVIEETFKRLSVDLSANIEFDNDLMNDLHGLLTAAYDRLSKRAQEQTGNRE